MEPKIRERLPRPRFPLRRSRCRRSAIADATAWAILELALTVVLIRVERARYSITVRRTLYVDLGRSPTRLSSSEARASFGARCARFEFVRILTRLLGRNPQFSTLPPPRCFSNKQTMQPPFPPWQPVQHVWRRAMTFPTRFTIQRRLCRCAR